MTPTVALTVAGVLLGFVLMANIRTPSGRGATTSVSVIIPARNEERTLPRLLESLADQSLAPHEVIVVDDSSTDATAEVAAAAGARVVRAGSLPEGWVGKPWACHVGSLHASGRALVFLDADVAVAPDGLERIVATWERGAAGGLLSVQPFHTTCRAYEQLSAYPNLMSMMASGAFVPGRSRFSPVAFGPCLVTSAAAYRSVGGHEAVAGEVIEDVHLARTYGQAGLRVETLAGGSAISFRMYPGGLRQLVDGWTKNLAGGPRLVGAVPLVASVAWMLASVAAATNAGRAVVALATTGDVRWEAVALWALVAAQAAVLLRRIGSFRWWAAPAFPLLVAGFVALFVRSALHRAVHRTVTWHDRTIAVGLK